MPKKDRHRADGELFSLDIPSYRTFPVSAFTRSQGGSTQNLDPYRPAEPSSGIVRFRTVVIQENSVVAAVTKEGSAEFSNVRRRFHPARRFRIEISKLLQLSILFFR